MAENEQQSGVNTEATVPTKSTLTIFGTAIGTCEGWDQYDTLQFAYSNVVYNEHYAALFGQPASLNLSVDYENGVLQVGHEDDPELWTEWGCDGILHFGKLVATQEVDKQPAGNEAAQEDMVG